MRSAAPDLPDAARLANNGTDTAPGLHVHAWNLVRSPPVGEVLVPLRHIRNERFGSDTRSARKLERYCKLLRQLSEELPSGQTPRALHFGYLSVSNDAAFPLDAAVAIASALAHHPNTGCLLHAKHEPHGPAWELIRHLVRLVTLPEIESYRGAPVLDDAHRLDIARLLVLEAMGGAFISTDSITLANLSPLADDAFGMALLPSSPGARPRMGETILFAAPGSAFARLWLDAWAGFPASGGAIERRAFATELPIRLYGEAPHLARILRCDLFHAPMWYNARRMLFAPFETASSLPLPEGQFVMPLWREVVYEELRTRDTERIRSEDCLYSRLASRALTSLRSMDFPGPTSFASTHNRN